MTTRVFAVVASNIGAIEHANLTSVIDRNTPTWRHTDRAVLWLLLGHDAAGWIELLTPCIGSEAGLLVSGWTVTGHRSVPAITIGCTNTLLPVGPPSPARSAD